MDFAHAYKHIGVPKRQGDFAAISIAPPGGPVHTAKLRTQPFGSSRAPANWGRATHFLQQVMLCMFDIVVSIYVEDCSIIEPTETPPAARGTFHTVCKLLGLSIEPSKGQPAARHIQLLGAEITITHEGIQASLPCKKRYGLTNDIRQILRYNQLNPAQPTKLRGRLGHAQSFAFGKLGRALLHPLTTRQYSVAPSRLRPLKEEITESLRRRLAVRGRNIPRLVPFGAPQPALLYSDDAGSGHISAVLFHEGSTYAAHTHLPRWFTRLANILEFEM